MSTRLPSGSASTDWLADEHAQRDIDREPPQRFMRSYRNPHHERGARQLSALGRVFGTGGES